MRKASLGIEFVLLVDARYAEQTDALAKKQSEKMQQ